MTRARNSANLASHGNLFVDIANDRTGIGSVVPDQNLHVAGTAGFHADVTFTGDNYNTTWDRSANSLRFNDGAQIKLGTGNDANIRHDGSNTWIQNTTGYLYIDAAGSSGGIRLISHAHWQQGAMAAFYKDGGVQLFHDASSKFTTEAYGTNTTGTAVNDGLVVAGVATVTTMNVTGVLTYDDVTSVDSVGIVTARAGVHCSTDGVANGVKIGAGQDLILQHNGTNSFIDNNTGDLYIQTTGSGDDILIESADDFTVKVAGSETAIQATGDGAVELYHNNNLRVQTDTSSTIFRGGSGIRVYGDAGQNQNGQISIHPQGSAVYSNLFFYNSAGNANASIIGHEGQTLFFTGGTNGPLRFRVNGSGFHSFQEGNTERVHITAGGDLSLRQTTQNEYRGLLANSTAINLTLGSTAGANPRMYLFGTGNGQSTAGDILMATGNGGIVNIRSAELIKFEVNSDNSTAEALRITSGGSVNIGGDYTQTSSKLKVTGTVTVDGGFALSAGSFTAPGGFSINSGNVIISGDIAHDADSNTFFGFGAGADTFRVQTNGSERLRIDSSGNLLIGRTSWVDNHFDNGIYLAGGTQAGMKFMRTASGSAGTWDIGIDTDRHFKFVYAGDSGGTGAEKVRITSNGNILVGKTADAGKGLEIYQNANAALRIQNSSTGQGAADGLLIETAGSDALFWNYENAAIRFGTNNGERVRIDSDGRLLVNRTSNYASSSEKLSVNGMTSIQGSSTSSANLYIFNTDTTGSGTVQPYIFLHDGSGIRGGLGLQYSTANFIINGQSAIQFRTGSSGVGGTERVRITNTGNVGINDTNPGAKLTVKQSGLADNTYSFAASYRSGNHASGYTASGISISGTADNSNGEKHTSYVNFSSRDPALNGSHGAGAWITMSNPDSQGSYGTGQLDFYIRHGSAYTFPNDPQAPSGYWMSSLFTIKSSGNLGVSGSTGTDFTLLDGMVINTNNGSAGLLINSTSSSHNAYIGFSYGSGSSTSHNDQYSAYIGRVGDNNLILGTDNTIRASINPNGRLILSNSEGIQLSAKTSSLYAIDASLSYYASNNAVYLNGAGASGWLRLSAAGSSNNRTAINLYGHSYSSSDRIDFRTNSTERMRIDSGGKIKLFPAGESGGAQGAPLYLQVQTNVTNINAPTGGTDQTGMFRIEERGSTNGRYHGIELRNRNSGDIRILNKDINVSNGAVLVFAVDDNGQFDGSGTIRQYLEINGQGQTRAITLSGSYHVVASARDGLTSANAAVSAWEIKKTLGPAARTGYYYLKNPYDGTTSQWWCDMETDGGGWVLIAHTGDGAMSDQGTNGTHWWSRNNKGGFDTVGAGYYAGGGYWRQSNGAWGENTNGQLMWDVRTHYSEFNNQSNDKVVFNWGTNHALPTGNSGQSNIPGASSRRFNEWCYPVVNAPGFNPMNYDNNVRSNVISGANHFTEHMLMTWSFRNTSGNADNGENGPYWQIGSHANGLHQHYEETLSGDSTGDGSYQVVSNEDTGWGGGGTNNGYRRIARDASSGTCNVWLR